MKRILVIGAAGMAGHIVYRFLRSTGKYQVGAMTRTPTTAFDSLVVDIEQELDTFTDLVMMTEADVVINCIGLLVKASQDNPAKAIYINSFLPHLLENITKDTNTKVVHLSTDCIFDGKAGPYTELDLPTETNWYGRSKALGEIVNKKDLTMRTSIIGPELKENGTGLFHWFSKQTGEVKGYSNHWWNGITTLELAKQIDRVLDIDLSGIYHFTPELPITKGDLLSLIKDTWGRTDIDVVSVPAVTAQSKILINNRKKEYDPQIPSYPDQLKELKQFLIAV